MNQVVNIGQFKRDTRRIWEFGRLWFLGTDFANTTKDNRKNEAHDHEPDEYDFEVSSPAPVIILWLKYVQLILVLAFK